MTGTTIYDRDGQPFTRMAVESATEAEMTPQEYRDFIRGLRDRPMVERMAAGGRLDDFEITETERNEGNYKAPRADAPPPGDGLTPAERFERVAEWLLSLEGRSPVQVADITHLNKRVAVDWLRAYTGDFEFLTDLRDKTRGRLSDSMAKGVLNCLRADLLRGPAAPAPTPVEIADDLAALLP